MTQHIALKGKVSKKAHFMLKIISIDLIIVKMSAQPGIIESPPTGTG
jgi:hypothetical protein